MWRDNCEELEEELNYPKFELKEEVDPDKTVCDITRVRDLDNNVSSYSTNSDKNPHYAKNVLVPPITKTQYIAQVSCIIK